MARTSKMENKTPYQKKRESLGLSREKAADILKGISYERLFNIEHGRTEPTPEDILIMAEGYKDPTLCNIFCSHHCGIGKHYVPHIEVGELPAITLNIIAMLNELDKMKNRLIEVCADGRIDEDEQEDFTRIQASLEQLSRSIEALQLWNEKMRKEESGD